jgi:hypothetical protein
MEKDPVVKSIVFYAIPDERQSKKSVIPNANWYFISDQMGHLLV